MNEVEALIIEVERRRKKALGIARSGREGDALAVTRRKRGGEKRSGNKKTRSENPLNA